MRTLRKDNVTTLYCVHLLCNECSWASKVFVKNLKGIESIKNEYFFELLPSVKLMNTPPKFSLIKPPWETVIPIGQGENKYDIYLHDNAYDLRPKSQFNP